MLGNADKGDEAIRIGRQQTCRIASPELETQRGRNYQNPRDIRPPSRLYKGWPIIWQKPAGKIGFCVALFSGCHHVISRPSAPSASLPLCLSSCVRYKRLALIYGLFVNMCCHLLLCNSKSKNNLQSQAPATGRGSVFCS